MLLLSFILDFNIVIDQKIVILYEFVSPYELVAVEIRGSGVSIAWEEVLS